jgi:1,4-alpha-glucan branching enzyme
MRKKFFEFFGFLSICSLTCVASAQNPVSTIPLFPKQNDTLTVIYNASLGNAALLGQTGPIFAHTGVTTDQSGTWRFVQGNWGTVDNKVRMDSIGNNLYRIRIYIPSFYNLPANTTVTNLAFVFRNSSGSVVGRNSDGTDIYTPVFQPGTLNVLLQSPLANQLTIGTMQDSIRIVAVGSAQGTFNLYRNDTLLSSRNDSLYQLTTVPPFPGSFNYRLTFSSGALADTVDFSYLVRSPLTIAPVPTGFEDGIHYLNDSSALLVLYAPLKKYVYLTGDFNDWKIENPYQLNRSPDSLRYWIQLNGLEPGKEYAYQYMVDGELYVADYYTEKTLDPWNDASISSGTYPNLKPYPTGKAKGIVSVLQTKKPAYVWQNGPIKRPRPEELVIYELLVRDFTGRRNYKTLIDTLSYLQRMGVNALKIMPVMEFENNESWGYNVSFYFAPDKFYGTEDDLKALIDTCHGRGIAVILDIVLNHSFGQSPMVQLYFDRALGQPLPSSPWFNVVAKHPFNVGYDINHESEATRYFMNRVIKHWVLNYKIDGYRFDLSKGFTQKNSGDNVGLWGQYDSTRVRLWKRAFDSLQQWSPGFYTILEHFADNQEEKELADYGLMFWGNINFSFNQITMGYQSNSSINQAYHGNRSWTKPHLISFMESHDEERLMVRNYNFGNAQGSYSTRLKKTALERMKLASTLFFSIPGPKMIWQFGELGYDVPIDQNGRTGNKPILWNYQNDPERASLYNYYSSLIRLKSAYEVFKTGNTQMNTGGLIKTVSLSLNDTFAIAIGNMDVKQGTATVNFPRAGKWYNYVNNDSIQLGSSGSRSISLPAGGYQLWLSWREKNTFIPEPQGIVLETDIAVFPNPAFERLELRFSHTGGPYEVYLLNASGARVATLENGSADQGVVTKSYALKGILSDTATDRMGFVQVLSGGKSRSVKIILQEASK